MIATNKRNNGVGDITDFFNTNAFSNSTDSTIGFSDILSSLGSDTTGITGSTSSASDYFNTNLFSKDLSSVFGGSVNSGVASTLPATAAGISSSNTNLITNLIGSAANTGLSIAKTMFSVPSLPGGSVYQTGKNGTTVVYGTAGSATPTVATNSLLSSGSLTPILLIGGALVVVLLLSGKK